METQNIQIPEKIRNQLTAEVPPKELSSNPDLVNSLLRQYLVLSQSLWDNPDLGIKWEVISTITYANKQVDKRLTTERKSFLKKELNLLLKMPSIRQVIDKFLSFKYSDQEVIQAGAHLLGISITESEAVRVNSYPEKTLVLELDESTPIPEGLGRSGGPGEVAKTITIVANFAPWRDTKLRRFTSITITTEEVWPKCLP